MGPRTHTVCVGHTAKTHLDSANADARPSREATPGAAATPPGGPADRAPFKVACSGESAPPGSPPGVPGPRLATNVATEHRAGPGGAANVAAEHRAGPSPPVRTTEKKVNSGFQIQPTYQTPCSRTQDFPGPPPALHRATDPLMVKAGIEVNISYGLSSKKSVQFRGFGRWDSVLSG